MSKSVGNITYPKDIVNKYGVNNLRWWVAGHASQQTSIQMKYTALDEEAKQIVEFRRLLRFLHGYCGERKPSSSVLDIDLANLSILNRYFLNCLYKLDETVSYLLEIYCIYCKSYTAIF